MGVHKTPSVRLLPPLDGRIGRWARFRRSATSLAAVHAAWSIDS